VVLRTGNHAENTGVEDDVGRYLGPQEGEGQLAHILLYIYIYIICGYTVSRMVLIRKWKSCKRPHIHGRVMSVCRARAEGGACSQEGRKG